MIKVGLNSRWRTICGFGALLFVCFVSMLWARFSGQWLVVDRPERADVIVVLAADSTDLSYYRGLELLRSGYGKVMFVDASTRRRFGEAGTEASERFIRATAGESSERIRVCPLAAGGEAESVHVCVAPLRPRRLLLVTSDFYSRRALSLFQNRLPQYNWSIAVAPNNQRFGVHWWRERAWAATYVREWQEMIWWFVVDR